jgi:DNA-binding winged helix-turn-helix (wHTH) protein/tetratricopeptide (TPR) repeat protein
MSRGQQIPFGPFKLDPTNLQLSRGSRQVPLTPKAFDVLSYLVQHAGQLVTKDELLKSLWSDSFVGDSVLKVCILEIRKALGDQAAAPKFIETVHRRGYRFIGPIDDLPSTGNVLKRQKERREKAGSLPRPEIPKIGGFVGRDSVLQRLRDCLAKALRGERQTVFITGEAGIGKTTLLNAFVESLAFEPSLRIAQGQCLEQYGTGEAYMPVLDAFSRLCREPENACLLSVLGHQAPTWLAQLPSLARLTDAAQLQRQTLGATPERMLREMTYAIETMAAEVPIVLALEDLHWSDYSTLDLIAYLARRREPARLLIVATYRPVEVILSHHPLRTVKQELQIHEQCVELALEFLSEDAVSKYLELRFSEGTISREFTRFVHLRTDGNPLFVVNVVDFLESQHWIVKHEGQWEFRGPTNPLDLKVPESLRHMIDRQLGHLAAEEQLLTEAASVAGGEFSVCTVAAALNAAVAETEESLEALAKRGQFVRSTGVWEFSDGSATSQFSFVHSLYQNVIYQRLTENRRRRFHQLIGEHLESAHGSDQPVAAELAVHFERARDYQRAIQYLRLASEQATRRYANREAGEYLTRALTWVDHLPEPARAATRVEILERRGLVWRSMGDMKRSAQDFEARVECAQAQKWLEVEVMALFQFCSSLSWFDLTRCLKASQEADVRSSQVSDELIQAHARGSCAYWHLLLRGWREEDVRSCAGAVEAARRLNDRSLLSLHLPRLAYFQCLRSEYSAAGRSAEEGLQVALEIGDAFDYMICQFFQAWALLRLGQWDTLLPLLSSALEMAEKNRNQPWATLYRLEQAWAYQQMFCFETTLKLCQDGFEKAKELQFGYGQLMSSVLLGFSHLGLQDIGSALHCFESIGGRLEREQLLMDWIWEIPLHLGLSRCRLLQGDFIQAREEAELAFSMASVPVERTWMAAAQSLLIEISMAEGRHQDAQQALSKALGVLEGTDLPLAEWRVFANAAELYQRYGRKSEAIEYRTRCASGLKRMAGRLSKYPDLLQTFLTSPQLPGKLRQILNSSNGPLDLPPSRKAARASSLSNRMTP